MNPVQTTTPFTLGALRFRTSQLIKSKIINERKESLGEVQDIVLTSDNRSIAYAVVAFGGFLGMGEKLFAMPWRLFDVTRNTEDGTPLLSIAIDQHLLKTAPGFDKSKWPDMANMAWSRQVDTFYSSHRATAADASRWSGAEPQPAGNRSIGSDPKSENFQCRRLSQLIGLEVVDAKRKSLAKIEDLILDAKRARIEGAALSFGGIIGLGKHLALVPMESLTLDRHTTTFSMPCTPEDLQAMALPGGKWPPLDNDEWLTRGQQQCNRAKTSNPSQGSSSACE